jgi:hypothetical protein
MENNMSKLQQKTRLQVKDIAETSKRLGEREISEAELKFVTGGAGPTQGGTTSDTGDTDQ